MKVLLVFTFVFVFISSGRGDSRIDSLIQNLSVEEKIDLLFVDIPTSKDKHVVFGLDSLSKTMIYDARHGISEFSFLDDTLYYSLKENELKEKLRQASLHLCIEEGFQGVLTPGDHPGSSYLDLPKDSISLFERHQIIDFPRDVFFEEYKIDEPLYENSSEKITQQKIEQSGYGILNIWNHPPQLRISLNELLQRNVLFNNTEDLYGQLFLQDAIASNIVSDSLLNERVRKVLELQVHSNDSISFPVAGDFGKLAYQAARASVSLYQRQSILPLKRLDTISVSIINLAGEQGQQFVDDAKEYQSTVLVSDSLATLQLVVCSSTDSLRAFVSQQRRQSNYSKKYVLVTAGGIGKSIESYLGFFTAVLSMPHKIDQSWSMLAQSVYGGMAVNGRSMDHEKLTGKSLRNNDAGKIRLGLLNTSEHSIPADSIAEIGSIIKEAIQQKAMPGCQLMLVHKGEVLIQKSYGHHTYKRKRKVRNSDLYDVASITKLAVTFPLVMQLYDEQRLDLDAPISDYISQLDTTDKADITIRELLLHQSGLISYIPFHTNYLDKESLRKRRLYSRHYSRLYNIRVDTRLYQNKNARFRKDAFSHKSYGDYKLQLTQDWFMNANYVDSMYNSIYASPLRSVKNYRYSDLGYYILQKIIEKEEKSSVDELFYKRFASLVGADRLRYKPLDYFPLDEIVPTEKDLAFRKELLHGYVHDQGAAMLGGVAAHAGLFANAGDLAKLAQMMLNEGTYGGQRFVNQKTIGYFTQHNQYGNRRGLGVDKPELEPGENSHVSLKASDASFGHTGFTGTMMWIDPEHELVYIFLSNRIHPNSYNKKLLEMNVRTRIQDVIYNSIID